ncbi:MAG: MOSC domain-containing protein [Congregibacter sp.]|nr:MOSC domain-containing protein [Congregibacter sp.]MDP5071662.1 MOSC domain-containing protein [Congregibacter sp.]
MDLSAIYRYPIKSARGHATQSATLDRFGISGDRRWMLIDDGGQFYSQRRAPRMALLDVQYMGHGLRLLFAGDTVEVTTPDARASQVRATVWGHRMPAYCADAAVNTWLSQCLGERVRLVYCPDDASRAVDPEFLPGNTDSGASKTQYVSFTDGFPLLIIGEASLDDLNARLPAPVPMDRFRPNIVVRGAHPFAEDHWRRLRIGSTELAIVKPCSRCAIPAIDQLTAERDPSINRVLASYRRRDGEIYFGMNAVVITGDTLSVGDAVSLVS